MAEALKFPPFWMPHVRTEEAHLKETAQSEHQRPYFVRPRFS